MTNNVVPLLSPSVNEAVIKRHFGDDPDDPVLTALFEAVKTTREMATKARETTDAVLQNAMSTPAANHTKARAASFALIESATQKLDAATKAAKAEVAALRTKVSAPLVSKDSTVLMRQRELRERLFALPAAQRLSVMQEAIKGGDDVLCGAVLNAAAWELGMTESDHALLRASWAAKNFAPELKRLDAIGKAITDTTRAGTAALAYVDELTDASLIEQATASERKADDALKAIKG